MKTASPQDTFDIVFGSGALVYSWWLQADYHINERGEQSADDWALDVTADNGNGGRTTVTVDHKLVMRTARYVYANRGARAEGWSEALEREAYNLLYDADECDLDADAADELLQVAVLGSVVYGLAVT